MMETFLTTQELFAKGDAALSSYIRDLFIEDYDACSCVAEIFDKDPDGTSMVLIDRIPHIAIFGDRLIVPVSPTIDDTVALNLLKQAILSSVKTINKEHLYLLQSHYKEYDVEYTCLVGREDRKDLKPIGCNKYLYMNIDGYYLLPVAQSLGVYVCNFIGFGLCCIVDNILQINEE